MVVGRELIEYFGQARNCASILYAVILSPQNSCEVLLPSFCRWRNRGPGRWSQRIVRGSQDSKLHLSNIKAHVFSYFCAAGIRWSVIFSNGPANSLSHTRLTPGNINEMFWQRHFSLAWWTWLKYRACLEDWGHLWVEPGSLSALAN